MVWGCFSGFSGVGPINRINGIMNQYVYRDVLKEKVVPHTDNNKTTTPNTPLNSLKNGLKQIKLK